MARGSRIVDENNVVNDVRQFFVSKDGLCNGVMSGFVADNGTVRQFWPPTTTAGDPIVMTTTTETSYDIKAPTEGEAQAKADYNARTGNLELSSPDGIDLIVPVLAPAPRGTGQYLCKFEPTSGIFETHFPAETPYNPAMKEFDGSTGYYTLATTASGNLLTVVARFQIASQAGSSVMRILSLEKTDTSVSRVNLVVGKASHADPDFQDRLRVAVQNSAGTVICLLFSDVDVADDALHTVFFSFDGDTGVATFKIDGVDADNAAATNRVAPTTGTVYNTSLGMAIGGQYLGAQLFPGKIGFIGYRDTYLTNWNNFFEADGSPKNIEATLTTAWDGSPAFWSATGDMANNDGSAGDMTANGTITNYQPPDGAAVDQWHDVFEEGSLGLFHNYLPNTSGVAGQMTGAADFSIAEDDGTGYPDLGSVVTKTINFIAERTGNNLLLTQNEWSLSDVRINEEALVRVSIDNDGILRGYEGVTQALQEAYCASWNSQYKVKVDIVSGALTTGTTGSYLSTASQSEWTLSCAVGASDSAEVDLTIWDGVNTVTKRINLDVSSSSETSSSSLSTDFTQYNSLSDSDTQYGGSVSQAGFFIYVNADGTVDAERIPITGGHEPTFPQDWNTSAPAVPDPENFECRMTVVTGDAPNGTLGTWLNCATDRTWDFIAFADALTISDVVVDEISATVLLEIREVGRPATVKQKTLDLYAIATSNGGAIP